ncbi:unnamed protein product, partial [Rotaria socialis]
MSGQKSNSTAPKSTAGATVSRTTTSDAIRSRRRMTQNYLVIWVDGNIDENTEDCRNTLAQLHAAVSEVNVCRTPEECIEFLNEMNDGKAFVISSGALGQGLVNDIHGMPKVGAIYIFCGKSPVWWYTCEMFLYGMLNWGLRSLDMEAMSKLGFFIRNLHLQLKQLHQEQSAKFKKSFTVYRGQGMSKEDFQNLLDSKGGLLSFNNFLSTSMERKVGMEFVERTMKKNQDIVGVIFIMTIDQIKISPSNTPFAMIDEHSAIPSEQEILFTMHTVFRVVEIKQTPKNNRLWEVHLTITDENDPQLSTLTNRIKEEVRGSTGWYRMGKLMLQLGHFNQAEELYNELLKNASTDSDRAFIYHMLGYLKNNQGKYPEAIKFYENSLTIREISLPANHPSLATSYNNI